MNLLDMAKTKKVEEKPKKQEKVKVNKDDAEKEVVANGDIYKFPFTIYLAAEKKDVSHIFEDGKTYTDNEITKTMLEHGFYEFAGKVTYDFMANDNVLVPVFQQHKKG